MTPAGIGALASGYPRRLWGEKLLVMLEAYLDDSIASSGDKRLFIAGYVQTAEVWMQFQEAWDEELHRAPAIDYFKMAECAARDGQFRGWGDDDRWGKLEALARIIQHYEPWAVHTSVSTLEFNRILKNKSMYPMRTPYYPVCTSIMIQVGRLHRSMGLNVPCSFIFDDQSGLSAKIVPIFDFLKKASPVHKEEKQLISGSPRFEDDKNVLPLQAADLLAWFVRRSHERTFLPKHIPIGEMISRPERHFAWELTTADLQSMADLWPTLPFKEKHSTKEGSAERLAFMQEEFERREKLKSGLPD